MGEDSMAQEKDERLGAATMRKSGEAADDSVRRAATPGRSAPRESASAAESGPAFAVSAPGRRRERYLVGIRSHPGAQLVDPRRAMDEAVEYLGRVENVEVVRRMKPAAMQPFATGGRGASEVVV